jgi:hypothetical protein
VKKLYRNRFGGWSTWEALTALDLASYTKEERDALVAEMRRRIEDGHEPTDRIGVEGS